MQIELGTVQIIMTIILGCASIIAAVLGGFFTFYHMNKKEGLARTQEFKERLKEFEERQEKQREADKEELREIKNQIYNHLPTQIRAVEAEIKELRSAVEAEIKELRSAVEAEIKYLKTMIMEYIIKKSISETHDVQSESA